MIVYHDRVYTAAVVAEMPSKVFIWSLKKRKFEEDGERHDEETCGSGTFCVGGWNRLT